MKVVYAIAVCAMVWLTSGCAHNRGGVSSQSDTSAGTSTQSDTKPMPTYGGPGTTGTSGVGTAGGPGR